MDRLTITEDSVATPSVILDLLITQVRETQIAARHLEIAREAGLAAWKTAAPIPSGATPESTNERRQIAIDLGVADVVRAAGDADFAVNVAIAALALHTPSDVDGLRRKRAALADVPSFLAAHVENMLLRDAMAIAGTVAIHG